MFDNIVSQTFDNEKSVEGISERFAKLKQKSKHTEIN